VKKKMPSQDIFAVKGDPFFKKTFYSTVLSTNIAVTRYLASMLFEDNLDRIVWASNDKTFRKRQEQVMKRSPTLGTLDMPYCSFRLSQDGLEKGGQRPWFNQALNVEGIWIEDLGRKVRVTPVQLRYEGVICVQHDTDLYWLQQLLLWDASNEKLLGPVLETESDSGEKREIKNIAVITITPHMNTRFAESDWIVNNKIQAIDLDIQVDTYLLRDNRAGYWIAVKSALGFISDTMPYILAERHKGDEDDYPEIPKIPKIPEEISPDDMMILLQNIVFA
jgi:hypothetical protein